MDHQRAHGFYPTYLWHDGEKLLLEGNTHLNAGKTKEFYGKGMTAKRRDRTGKKVYSQNVFLKHIVSFIKDNKAKPFFIYHSTQLPHGPVDIPEVHQDFINDDRLSDVEKEYASMVKMLDDHVGVIMATLKTQGIDDNTIVMFASDNGHETYYLDSKTHTRQRSYHGESDVFKGSMALAGMKWTSWQGGMRVPLIVRWPNHIAEGTQSDLLVAGYDYMPTFSSFWQGDMPKGKDGISFAPTLLSQNQVDKHDYIFVANNAVITKSKMKLVRHKQTDFVFDLANDPGERKDLAKTKPKVLHQLQAIFSKEHNAMRKDI